MSTCLPELRQARAGFQAELDVASIWERVKVFKLTACPSIFLGTVGMAFFLRFGRFGERTLLRVTIPSV